MKRIYFSPPDIRKKDFKEIKKVLISGWITTGPETKKLEKVISNYCGADNCVCLNSQTACSEMILRVLGIGPGDEVIVPSYTYTASCSVILHVGAKPIMIDCKSNSCEIDYDGLQSLINQNTKAIIPVDIGGIPCDYDKIYEAIYNSKHLFRPSNKIQSSIGRIIVLADTAHSLGATYKGRKTGTIADFSSFSFHAVKNMTTAEGGALVWNNIDGVDNGDIYKHMQLLSLHGQSKDALSKMNSFGKWEYDIVEPWYKCNMTDILASLGISQMQRYDKLLRRRKEIYNRYCLGLQMLDIDILQHIDSMRESSYHLFIVRLKGFSEYQRNEFVRLMANDNIACNVHYKPLPMFSAYRRLGFDIKNYPNAFNFYRNEVTLPLHTKLSNKDVKRILDSFRKNYNLIKNNEKME